MEEGTRGPAWSGMAQNETILTVVLLALGIYFSVLLIRGFLGYLRFRRVRPTALITWPVPHPAHLRFMIALGILNTGLTVLNGLLARPFHHVFGLGVMALYFVLMVPLSLRIHLGFYRDGVWADAGFLRYGDIGRLAFLETPEIVLVLLPRGGSGSFKLPVPPAEYGAVRKVLEEKIRDHVVNVDKGILGL
jgi:hypothetical protein